MNSNNVNGTNIQGQNGFSLGNRNMPSSQHYDRNLTNSTYWQEHNYNTVGNFNTNTNMQAPNASRLQNSGANFALGNLNQHQNENSNNQVARFQNSSGRENQSYQNFNSSSRSRSNWRNNTGAILATTGQVVEVAISVTRSGMKVDITIITVPIMAMAHPPLGPIMM
jgi:hypothetical protein